MKTRRYDYRSICSLIGFIVYAGAIILALIVFFSCTSNKDGMTEAPIESVPTKETRQPVKHTAIEQVPVLRIAANSLAQHFWDSLDIVEPASNSIDETFNKFIHIIPRADDSIVCIAINESLKKTSSKPAILARLLELYEIYFYNPNSPFRNDEYYIAVLQYITQSDDTTEGDRLHAEFKLELASKNRINARAADVAYTLNDGKTGSLYSIINPFTLLMFYNPDCYSCEELIAYIEESPIITKAIEKNKLAILAFYPDSDLSIWKRNLKKIPADWINGYDDKGVVKSQLLYDLKAIPTLYLLDRDKKVLLKDADLEAIEILLRNEIFGEKTTG